MANTYGIYVEEETGKFCKVDLGKINACTYFLMHLLMWVEDEEV